MENLEESPHTMHLADMPAYYGSCIVPRFSILRQLTMYTGLA